MKQKAYFIIFLTASISFMLTACSGNTNTESIEYGDIDMDKVYVDTQKENESLVERVEMIDMSQYYSKVPISITAETERGSLPDSYGAQQGDIDRIHLNGISFDVNKFGIMYGGNYGVEDGVFHISFPDGTIDIKLAQIYNGNSSIFDEDSFRIFNNVIQEYYDAYDNSDGYMRKEHGDVYTYSGYVDFLKENPSFQRDLSVYSAEQVFDIAVEALGLSDVLNYEDFMVNEMASNFDYSDWYEAYVNYQKTEDGKETKISIKRNDEGVFVFLTEYQNGVNISESGETLFSPSAILNFSQNHYITSEETYDKYVEMLNNAKGTE